MGGVPFTRGVLRQRVACHGGALGDFLSNSNRLKMFWRFDAKVEIVRIWLAKVMPRRWNLMHSS